MSNDWVGLSDEEANRLWESTDSDWELMKRTEKLLREKNAKPAEKNPTCDECDGTGKVHGSQTTLACPECTPDDAPWPLKRIADLERQVEHLKERNRKQFKTIAAVSREPLTRADIEDALRAKLAAELQDLMYSHKAETGECDEINCDFLAAWQDAMDIILGVSEHGRT